MSGRRYCGMCDAWMTQRECPACGAPTDQGVKCASTQAVSFTCRPNQPDEHATATCYLAADHLGSHEGKALRSIWWWNEHGHGVRRGRGDGSTVPTQEEMAAAMLWDALRRSVPNR